LANRLKSLKSPTTGELLFVNGIDEKNCRDHFKSIMKLMKDRSNEHTHETGNDDEEENEEVTLAEDLYEDYTSHIDLKEDDKIGKTTNRKREIKQAETLQRASLGDLSRDKLQDLRKRQKGPGKTPAKTQGKATAVAAPGTTPRSRASSVTSADGGDTNDHDNDNHFHSQHVHPAKILKLREQSKQEKHKLRKQRLELQEKELAERERENAHRREQDAKDREARREQDAKDRG
jgi:hypothetical protein